MSVTDKVVSPGSAKMGGFTLIEVLVALLVLSLGLLGLAALQTTSLKFNTDSYLRTQLTFSAYDIIDRMRANPAGVASGGYWVNDTAAANAKIALYKACATGSCNCDSTACNSANLSLYDLGRWYAKHSDMFAGSADNRATIVQNGNEVTVTIHWNERDIVKTQSWVVQL